MWYKCQEISKNGITTLLPVSFSDREKHGTQLGEPVWIDSSNALHVLLGSQHKFVVYNIIWCEASSKQCTCRMKVTLHAGSAVDVFTNALESGGLVEVCRANTLADNIPIRSTRNKRHIDCVHNIDKLWPNFTCLAHSFGMNEMFGTPVIAIAWVSMLDFLWIPLKVSKSLTCLLSTACKHARVSSGHFLAQRTFREQRRFPPVVPLVCRTQMAPKA